MRTYFYNWYRRFEDELSENDRRLLNLAEHQRHDEIRPEMAESAKAREILKSISSAKYHQEEALYGVI